MRLGTRLALALLPTIGLVMAGYGWWALAQRETTLRAEARRETEAYARALAVAVERAADALTPDQLRDILDDVSRVATVYGITIYGADGAALVTGGAQRDPDPGPPAALQAVLAGAGPATAEQDLAGEPVLVVLHPVHGADGTVIGALEVAQPLASVRVEAARVRSRFLLNTLTLLVAVGLVTAWLVRRFVTAPIGRFIAATRAVGRGDLTARLAEPGGELGQLGTEFNRMAAQLSDARAQRERDADQRVALERRLRESEKMATIGKLAAGLAHEIAAPLNVISGRAELMQKRPGSSPDQQRQLQIIRDQIGRITTIVRNLLDFGRRREPVLARTDLAGIVDGVMTFLDAECARADVTVVREDPRPLWVEVDADHLHQVLVNLILNAIQAMSDAPPPRTLTIVADRDDRAVTLRIRDTGPGVSTSLRARLFDPFVTSKAAGTGLGLVVARSIAEEHGGKLTLETTDAPGACFALTLPAAGPVDA